MKIIANYENLTITINNLNIEIKLLEKKLKALLTTGEDDTKLNRFSTKFKEYLMAIDFLKYENQKVEKEENDKEKQEAQAAFKSIFSQLLVNRDDYKPEIIGKNIYNTN